jgi:hypothetical protein
MTYIHGTRYILHQMSGSFFTEITANRTIIRGSLAHLSMAKTLPDGSVTETMTLSSVCKGFYDLHNFVLEFWYPHITKLASLYSDTKNDFATVDAKLLQGSRVCEGGMSEMNTSNCLLTCLTKILCRPPAYATFPTYIISSQDLFPGQFENGRISLFSATSKKANTY